MQARLTASDIACRRGERLLFRALSLDLAPGDLVHVTGANGIGKTSLLRLLAGLMTPFAGQVVRTGTLGLLDERHGLDPDLALGRALAFWARVDGREVPACELERLGLLPLLDIPVRYLSTGQKKRAALARLIGQSAAIWLLDEPLNGLDDAGAHLLRDLARAHSEAGGIAAIASHQPLGIAHARAFPLADFAP